MTDTPFPVLKNYKIRTSGTVASRDNLKTHVPSEWECIKVGPSLFMVLRLFGSESVICRGLMRPVATFVVTP